MMGDTLRRSYVTPMDTMITADIPLLLTRLSQVPGIKAGNDATRSVKRDGR